MVDDEERVGRTPTPLGFGRQRADFPSQTSSSASSTPYGSPATSVLPSTAPAARAARRISPKSAGSASLPTKPFEKRAESWERESSLLGRGGASVGGAGLRGRRKTSGSLRRVELKPAEGEEEGPFADPLRSDWGNSTSDVSSFPPTSPDINFARRGSAVSTSSAISSYSRQHSFSASRPGGGGGPSSIATRHSLSSFGGYTLDSIGDLSTSGMPLLRKQATRESSSNGYAGGIEGSEASPPASRDGRKRAAKTTSSTFSVGTSANGHSAGGGVHHRPSSVYSVSQRSRSDSSSIHSYPPKPRQRTWSAEEGGELGENGFAREIERTGATSQVKRETSRDQADAWPAFVTTSYIHSPVARPAAAYQASLSTYSFPSPSTRTPPIPVNPLAPLRKRLARSLASTTSGHDLYTEVQLLLELVDALEHCITSFSSGDGSAIGRHRASDDSTASHSLPASSISNLSSSPPDQIASSSTLPPPIPSPPSVTSTAASSSLPAPRSQQSKASLVDEVRLLVRELAELVPDAQRCLSTGQYGPLAHAGASTKTLLLSLEDDAGTAGLGASPDWWPRRLAKDCRALLEEAGLPTGTASTAWLVAAQLSLQAGERVVSLGVGGNPIERVVGAFVPRSLPPFTLPSSVGEEDEGMQQEQHRHSHGQGGIGWDSPRREQLLEQGKERWEAYRQRQNILEKSGAL